MKFSTLSIDSWFNPDSAEFLKSLGGFAVGKSVDVKNIVAFYKDFNKGPTFKIMIDNCVIFRGVRVPDVRVGSGFSRLPKWSGIGPRLRIPVAASDIRIKRVCGATRVFDVIGYLLQLSGNS